LGRREAGSAAFASSDAACAATARRDVGADALTGMTRPLTSLAVVADAGTRCGRPAADPHTGCAGAPGEPPVVTSATIPSATPTASALPAATTR
jgi:hypothetical protein